MIYSCIMVTASLASAVFYGIYFVLLGSVIVAFLMLSVMVNEQVEWIKGSIRNKINYLISVSMLLLTIVLVAVSLITYSNVLSQNAEIMMSESSNTLALKLNEQINCVELTVINLYDISEKFRPSMNELKNENIVSEYMNQMADIAMSTANNTDGAVAVYYRLNPDIAENGTTGFFCIRSAETGEFEKNQATDLNAYDVNDVEHVGWYYLPVWAGEPTWVEPYENANINVEMISYVIPVYDENDLVGVIGMDIEFKYLEEIINELNIYNSSGAVLCSMSSSEIHYQKGNVFDDYIDSEVYTLLQGSDQSDEIQFTNKDGEKYGLYFVTLDNHMKLITYAKAAEMNSQLYSTIVIGTIVFVIVFTITLLSSFRLSKNIVDPLLEIINATKQYSMGNWDVKIDCDSKDEIGDLADNVIIMANETKRYISKLSNLAKKDNLTGLRNRNDYLLYIEKCIADDAWSDGNMAIVMMDVNNLKLVNDSLGHDKGDELLKKTSKFICSIFPNSPVFRIGGDEFVIIVYGTDFEGLDQRMQDFHTSMKETSVHGNLMDVCVASGMAKMGIDGDTYYSIFNIADGRMYQNKREMKNEKK